VIEYMELLGMIIIFTGGYFVGCAVGVSSALSWWKVACLIAIFTGSVIVTGY